MDGKFCIAANARVRLFVGRYICVYLLYVYNPESVHGRFYGLGLKGNSRQ